VSGVGKLPYMIFPNHLLSDALGWSFANYFSAQQVDITTSLFPSLIMESLILPLI